MERECFELNFLKSKTRVKKQVMWDEILKFLNHPFNRLVSKFFNCFHTVIVFFFFLWKGDKVFNYFFSFFLKRWDHEHSRTPFLSVFQFIHLCLRSLLQQQKNHLVQVRGEKKVQTWWKLPRTQVLGIYCKHWRFIYTPVLLFFHEYRLMSKWSQIDHFFFFSRLHKFYKNS